MGSWRVYTRGDGGELRSIPLTSREHAVALACALCDGGLDVLRIEAPDGSVLSSADIARKSGAEDGMPGHFAQEPRPGPAWSKDTSGEALVAVS